MSAGATRELREAAVRVPCSTSNLGAGFDCVGLAFDRHLEAGFSPGGAGLELERGGTLADLRTPTADDVLVRAFRAGLRRYGVQSVDGGLFVTSSIPVGRGLGSSGAAVVAGLALAAAISGESLDRAEALGSAVALEGHPDNAAPSLLGGLVAVTWTDAGPLALRLPLSKRVAFAFAAPAVEVSTQRARAALPQHVPHSAATRNLGRVAALLHGLAMGDPAAVAAGFGDELHVPYRLPLIPRGSAVMEAAVDAGAWAATISGSGSGIVAACERDAEGPVLSAMLEAFRDGGLEADGFIARPDLHGAQPRDAATLRETLRPAR